jgi:DNA polymerase III delta prime subunit
MPKQLWVERYRPKTLNDVIFPKPSVKDTFRSFIVDGSIPHLLIYGQHGIGKSSLSNALISDLKVNSSDVLRIPCSDEKIEAMRDKVRVFASTIPYGKFKVVQLEEIDYLGHDAMALLRSLIEDSQDTCRFIATCNYITKVIPPLRSRFDEFEFTKPPFDDVLERAAAILETENIKFKVDDLQRVVLAGYPDLRKVTLLLERCSKTGTLQITEEQQVNDWKLGLLPLLQAGDVDGARKLVCSSATREEVNEVFRFIYDNLHKVPKLKQHEAQVIVLLAQYQYQAAFVADHEINIAACLVEIGAL